MRERVCEYMHQALRSLVEALEADPGRAVGTLEVLPEAEREQVVHGWNRTAEKLPDRCAHELFEEQACRKPDRVAVVFEGSSLSYGELNREPIGWPTRCADRGVEPESRVDMLERASS